MAAIHRLLVAGNRAFPSQGIQTLVPVLGEKQKVAAGLRPPTHGRQSIPASGLLPSRKEENTHRLSFLPGQAGTSEFASLCPQSNPMRWDLSSPFHR